MRWAARNSCILQSEGFSVEVLRFRFRVKEGFRLQFYLLWPSQAPSLPNGDDLAGFRS